MAMAYSIPLAIRSGWDALIKITTRLRRSLESRNRVGAAAETLGDLPLTLNYPTAYSSRSPSVVSSSPASSPSAITPFSLMESESESRALEDSLSPKS
jgi:hypothetical protein